MKSLCIIILVAFSLVFAVTEAADTEIEAFEQVKQQNFKGEFRQIRQLKLIKKPLESSGYFAITDAGLVWHTKEPFEVKYFINQEVIAETVDGNTKTQDLKDSPHMQAFSEVFAALIKLDEEVITQNFNIDESTQNGAWFLKLTPKTSPIDKVFSKIEILGFTQIEQIKTTSQAGDINTILLNYER